MTGDGRRWEAGHSRAAQVYRGGELVGTTVTLGDRVQFFAHAARCRPLDGAIFADTASLHAGLDRLDGGEEADAPE